MFNDGKIVFESILEPEKAKSCTLSSENEIDRVPPEIQTYLCVAACLVCMSRESFRGVLVVAPEGRKT